jgi:hypothetical protein
MFLGTILSVALTISVMCNGVEMEIRESADQYDDRVVIYYEAYVDDTKISYSQRQVFTNSAWELRQEIWRASIEGSFRAMMGCVESTE